MWVRVRTLGVAMAANYSKISLGPAPNTMATPPTTPIPDSCLLQLARNDEQIGRVKISSWKSTSISLMQRITIT